MEVVPDIDVSTQRQGRRRFVLNPGLDIVVAAPRETKVRIVVGLADKRAPGEVPLQVPGLDILRQGDGRIASAELGNRTGLARRRIGDLGTVPSVHGADPAAAESEPIQRRLEVHRQSIQRAVADVADRRKAARQRNDVDGVADLVMAQGDADNAVAPEATLIDQFADPALFGGQIRITAAHDIVLQLGGSGEVVEIQLPHLPLETHTELVVGPRGPGRQQARFDEGEGLLHGRVARLADGRALHAHSAFNGEIVSHPPDALAEHLPAGFLDRDRG